MRRGANIVCRNVTAEILEQTADDTRKQIELHCKMECHRPFTVHCGEYCDLTGAFRANLEERRNHKERSSGPVSVTYTIKDNSGNSRTVSSKMANYTWGTGVPQPTLFGSPSPVTDSVEPPEYNDELQLMAQVLAYHVISSKRIGDNIPMLFETVFVCGFSDGLREILLSKLKLVGDSGLENCVKFAQDEPNIELERKKFEKQLDVLSNALKILRGFFNSK